MSTLASTASFDKSPQSKERGITLDLGFSAFILPAPPHLQDAYSKIQYTLVDCPGHASLIRTIIGGAQIIDLMFLVIDATKGIQTQTAEVIERQIFQIILNLKNLTFLGFSDWRNHCRKNDCDIEQN